MYSVVVTTLSGDVTTYNISIGGSVGDVGDLAVGDSRSNDSSSTPFSFFHRGRQVAASTPLAGLVDDSGNVVKLVLVSYTGSRAKKRQRRRGEANTTDSLSLSTNAIYSLAEPGLDDGWEGIGRVGETVRRREARGREARGREARGREARGREARGREARGREARGREARGREARGRWRWQTRAGCRLPPPTS
jgi:hypothetical protein